MKFDLPVELLENLKKDNIQQTPCGQPLEDYQSIGNHLSFLQTIEYLGRVCESHAHPHTNRRHHTEHCHVQNGNQWLQLN